MRDIRVFLAAPGDLAPERRLFFELLPQMTAIAGVRFEPLGYELAPAVTGVRPQDAINDLVDSSDVVLTAFHRHWGQSSTDSVVATSYTEEEFTRALSRFTRSGSPRIVCLFKNVDVSSLADPGPQLEQVLSFRRRLEQSRSVLYRTFSTEEDLRTEIEFHLYGIANGHPASVTSTSTVLLPVPEDAHPDSDWRRDRALAQQAVTAASNGQLQEAATLFARLSQTTVSVPVLEVAERFFHAIENQPAVEALIDRRMALLRDRRLAAREYSAALMRHGWLDDLIRARIEAADPDERELTERFYRRIFDESFVEELVNLMADHFSVGELRALTRFYAGDAATVASKMGQFIGGALPPVIERLTSQAMADLGIEPDAG